jgi:GNAT superfamily N-acetyltransferase
MVGPVDAPTLARREHDNMITADLLAAGQVPGAVAMRQAGLAVLATGLPLRLFNQVLVDGEPSPGALSEAVAILRTRGAPFSVTLRSGTDDELIPAVLGLGLRRHEPVPWMPGMALHPLPPAGSAPAPAGLEIRRVDDEAGVGDHIAAAAAGFDMPAAWLVSIITVDLARRPDSNLYAGYLDGRPVVTGLGIRTGATMGVYNIATIEEVRGRGFGSAMTMRIVDDAAAEGCDVATLQASPMGRPIYERLGFRTVVEYVAYVEP